MVVGFIVFYLRNKGPVSLLKFWAPWQQLYEVADRESRLKLRVKKLLNIHHYGNTPTQLPIHTLRLKFDRYWQSFPPPFVNRIVLGGLD